MSLIPMVSQNQIASYLDGLHDFSCSDCTPPAEHGSGTEPLMVDIENDIDQLNPANSDHPCNFSGLIYRSDSIAVTEPEVAGQVELMAAAIESGNKQRDRTLGLIGQVIAKFDQNLMWLHSRVDDFDENIVLLGRKLVKSINLEEDLGCLHDCVSKVEGEGEQCDMMFRAIQEAVQVFKGELDGHITWTQLLEEEIRKGHVEQNLVNQKSEHRFRVHGQLAIAGLRLVKELCLIVFSLVEGHMQQENALKKMFAEQTFHQSVMREYTLHSMAIQRFLEREREKTDQLKKQVRSHAQGMAEMSQFVKDQLMDPHEAFLQSNDHSHCFQCSAQLDSLTEIVTALIFRHSGDGNKDIVNGGYGLMVWQRF
ncbi:hypothetical protein IW261DRAFT_1573556 [Armillaria novae-zelandiae]|uniref:Uncharacterized protein n=1 Tax=Armillaria novae-zelandiae TaxID=153914 RepID=A0AA39TWR4_9AGAR|nr:hypothetical protein IW261DRAFT_1573556 [Armillaria novae-zelandiae]